MRVTGFLFQLKGRKQLCSVNFFIQQSIYHEQIV